MTPAEALSQATAYWTEEGYPDRQLARLRSLGFVLVPIEPDEATVERGAKAVYTAQTGRRSGHYSWPAYTEHARAAYAAMVAPQDEKESAWITPGPAQAEAQAADERYALRIAADVLRAENVSLRARAEATERERDEAKREADAIKRHLDAVYEALGVGSHISRPISCFVEDLKCERDELARKLAEAIRNDAREEIALWMIAHGYVTGHGDTVSDMLDELEAQAARVLSAQESHAR